MDEKDPRIKTAIDEIEPSEDAKARMLANIQRKAEMAAKIPAKAPQSAKILTFNRVMKWALPIAACLVIVILAGAFLAPNLFQRKYMAAEPNDAAMDFESQDSYHYAPGKENSASIRLPSEAQATERENGALEYAFTLDGHLYTLLTTPLDDSSKIDSYAGINEGNAVLRKTNEGLEMVWVDESYHYLLTNGDGATAEEIEKAFESLQ